MDWESQEASLQFVTISAKVSFFFDIFSFKKFSELWQKLGLLSINLWDFMHAIKISGKKGTQVEEQQFSSKVGSWSWDQHLIKTKQKSKLIKKEGLN